LSRRYCTSRLRLAANRRLIVQLVLAMEDEQAMHPLLRVEPVNPSPLADMVKRIPGIRLLLLNALRTLRGEPLRKLLAAGEVYVEVATLEGVGVGGGARFLEQVPMQSVLFGSHAPATAAATPPHGFAALACNVSTTVIPSIFVSFLPSRTRPCSRRMVSMTCRRGSPPVFIVICLVAWS